MERLTELGAVFETDHRGSSTMSYHGHRTPFVTIVLRGSYVEVRDAVPDLCRSGTLVVHSACEEHADRFSDDTRCLNVELPRQSAAPRICGSIALDGSTLRDAVHGVVRAFYRRPSELPAAVQQLQTILLDRRPERTDDRPPWLRDIVETFPWAAAVSLHSAATSAGVHETHFSRAFHRHVGMTATEYRSRARMCRASELLLTTTAPIARVAATCGFSDQSHLTRTFSQRLGLTPAGYRRIFAR